MNPERWRKIEDVFQAALDLSGAAREEFVRAECGGDAELRREVEKLIARYETEESFLESPVWTDSILLQPSLKQQIAVSLENEILPAQREQEIFLGRQIGAFRLTEELGKGGMGVVYLAMRADGEFRQQVAIKLIKRGMDTDFIVKRFRHERQIVATLNHPNIARLLDGGTTPDDLPYFVMEFVDGKPFFKYTETQHLDLRQKLKLFLQVCAAIAYAHGKQIIHRDIKPGNILVTEDGEPKLLDFGIAKILDPDLIHESVMPTATQMRLMTPEYASPEQVRGDEITPASDQYSLGVLLYELITGARPYKFPSRSPHEIARIICEEIPSEPSSGEFGKMLSGDLMLDKNFCRKLDRIVLKALRKNPLERYGSVREFAADIERFLRNEPVHAESFADEKVLPEIERKSVKLSPTVSIQKSIAVMPFKILNEVSDEDTGGSEFLGVGLADALITRLSNVKRFVVRPTSSVLRFGQNGFDSFAAGQELDVGFVLDGNILRADKRIRVSVQLLDVKTQSTVWAERFDEDFTDFLTLEDAISTKVAELLVSQLTTGEIKGLAKRGTNDVKAHEAYLRGRYHWNTFTETSFAQAFAAYREAISHDPNYALAHAGIADYYIWLGIFGVLPPQDTYQSAIQSAARAIEIDDKLPEAHAALGFARLCGNYDWEQGERDIRRALFLSPNYAVAHNWLAILLYTAARFDEGIEHARRAVELDPLTYQNYRTLSWGFYFSRRFTEALAEIDRTIEKFPMFGVTHANRSWALRAVGRTAEAVESSQKAMNASGGATFVLFGHAQSLAANNQREEALEIIQAIETEEKVRYVSRYQVALVYCYLNETGKALDALEAALADGEGWLVWLAVEPALDPLRGEPRFVEVTRRVQPPKSAAQIVSASHKIFIADTAPMPTTGRVAAPRRMGIKQGAFLIIVSFLMLPILVVLVASIDALTPAHLFIVFLLVFGGGLIRIIYAFLFEPKHAAPTAPANSSTDIDVPFSSRPTEIFQTNKTTAENHLPTTEKTKRRLAKPFLYALATISLIIVGYGFYNVATHITFHPSGEKNSSNRRWRDQFASMTEVKRLTTFGAANGAAMSPDGKLVAYFSEENGRQGLWVKPIDAGEAVRIVEDGAVTYRGLTFSPDGADIYYTVTANATVGAGAMDLYRISSAGGEPQKISDQIADNIGFAPDGRRIAYFGFNQKTRTRSLYVAEFDTNRQLQPPVELAARKFPVYIYGTPAFSPDGGKIAFVSGHGANQERTADISVLDLATGVEETLQTGRFFYVSAIAWRAGGEEIVFTANETRSSASQLWLIDYPSGATFKLTNDLSNYYGVTLANESQSLITTKSETTQNIWLTNLTAETDAAPQLKQITDGRERQDGLKGVRWTASNKILFVAGTAAENILTQTDADGANIRTISVGDSMPVSPMETSDGRYLIFVDEKDNDWAIWRRETATGAMHKITAVNALAPILTPDNRFIIYSATGAENRITLHRVSIEGDDETELTSDFSMRPAISPDGRFIACYYNGAATGNKWEIAILNQSGGIPVRVIKPPDTVNLQNPFERALAWSADSRSIFYLNDKGGVSNIYRVAADGSGKPVPMTHFSSGRIFEFSVAPDGKRAVISRGSTSSDVVNFRSSK